VAGEPLAEAELKKTVRQQVLAQRRALSSAQIVELGIAAQLQLLQLSVFLDATSVVLYAAIHGEVGTDLLCAQATAQGKAVLYPAMVGHALEFRQVVSLEEMVPGKYGILEPTPSSSVWEPAHVDLIVVPGVAFDLQGHRIGYGKGFYDRTLHTLEGCGRLYGLCYDFQLIEEIAAIPHDVRMDGVVTEHRVIFPCD
jgi:5-formyltetrahydrofolate cyclo-ligase